MQRVQEYKQLILPILNRHMVKHAAIFGSIAKGTANINSDLDILIEPAANFTLFNMLSLEQEIAAAIKCKVDVVEYNAIKLSIKEEVLRSAITIL